MTTRYQALATPAAVRRLLGSMSEDEFLALWVRLCERGTSLREYVGALVAKRGELAHVELFAIGGEI